MKKKIVTLGLIVALALSLVACGASVNDANVRAANIAVRAVDDYLDGYIDAKEASQTVKDAHAEMDTDDANSWECLTLEIDMTSISAQLSGIAYNGEGDLEKVIEYRNDMAKLAGLKKRK